MLTQMVELEGFSRLIVYTVEEDNLAGIVGCHFQQLKLLGESPCGVQDANHQGSVVSQYSSTNIRYIIIVVVLQ